MNEQIEPAEELEVVEAPPIKSFETLFVSEFTNGIIGPNNELLGPLKDGGTIIATTAPGGWGPMLTPAIKGAHEVTKPVFIEGAEIGDAVMIEVKSIQVTSEATASGTEQRHVDRYIGDPLLKVKCPGCGKLHPQTFIEGIGAEAVRCATCQTPTAPLHMANGYTLALHPKCDIAVTLGKDGARKVASKPEAYLRLPEQSVQNPVVSLAPSDLSGIVSRVRPFIGEIGTVPSRPMPATSNAGDTGRELIFAQHEMRLTEAELKAHCTDGHLHVPQVREGAAVICPVRVQGAGVYIGDVKALQGMGAAAGQAPSVSAIVQIKVTVIKKLALDGPMLLPTAEDLPHLAKPFTKDERKLARDVGEDFGLKQIEESFPLSAIGTGATINEAIDCGMERLSRVTGVSVDEVKNRATLCGGIELGRMPGLAIVTAHFPKTVLKNAKLYKAAKNQYDI